MNRAERTVVLANPEPEQAVETLGSQGGTRLSDVTSSIPVFKKVIYEAFKAEYDLANDNIVIHFFLPRRKVTEHYWKELFASALNDVGQEHFLATKPRLVARYTEEFHSWWFKAQGYGHIIDLDAYVTRFFEKLEERMAPSLQTQSKEI